LRVRPQLLKPLLGISPWKLKNPNELVAARRIVHVDEVVAPQRQPDGGAAGAFHAHLVPHHRRRIEHIAFHGMEFARAFKAAADAARLHDPPFRRTRMHMPKCRIGIERRRRATGRATASAADDLICDLNCQFHVATQGRAIDKLRLRLVK
jgi:hypothetical protein